jgi:Mg2+-importing ATPase
MATQADSATPTRRQPAAPAERVPGLTSAQAAELLERYGPNTIEDGHRFRVLREGLALFTNPLVLILLLASIISGLLGDRVDAAIIVVIVLLSVALDFYQVYSSQQAAAQLKSMIAPTTTVWRDGHPTEIAVRAVVPGDVLELHGGDLLPADADLLTPQPLSVDEAVLTGESLPVTKRGGADLPAGKLFAGTSIVSGMGQARVTATGARTQFGAIARSLVEKAPPTEFERGTRRFSLLITRTVSGLVLFVLLVNTVRHQDLLQSFLFALALAVGLTPEFLPMIVTITLSAGAQRMAKKKVIVRRLEAIENLGNMDILCSDKTGTLTRGTATVEAHVDAWGHESAAVLHWGRVNSALSSGMHNTLDEALQAAGPADDLGGTRKVAELPFDFERRRVSVLVDGPDGRWLVSKGAPEALLALCTTAESPDGQQVSLSADTRRQAQATLEALDRHGYHVLGVARRGPLPPTKTDVTVADERDLTVLGFVAFLDPPDPSAPGTLAQLAAAGVSVKILTGDSEVVAGTICERVGLRYDRVVLGSQLERMTDPALWAIVEQTEVFARVSPAQKNRLIHALKHRGHVVGYLGDGINDAPSLHAADVGISVANAVDVAKAAAEIVLLEKSLAAVYQGVIEGRRSFGNITKYVLMGTSSNFGNMLSVAVASAVLPFLPMLPVQILLNNFLYDLSQLTIPTDNVDPSYTARPRRWDMGLIERFMFGLGPISSLYDFLTFGVMLGLFHAGPELFRAGWFIESLATQTLVIFVIRTAGNPFRSRPSTPLLLSVWGGVLAGLIVVLTPLGAMIGFAPLPPLFFVVLVLMVATYLGLVQLIKRPFYEAGGWRAT